MIQCSNCQAKLTYPVYVNGIAYGTDCASKIFGVDCSGKTGDITKFVEESVKSREERMANVRRGYDLFLTHKDYLVNIARIMAITRTSNEWEYRFLLSCMETIGAVNWTDTQINEEQFYLSGFDLTNLSSKQEALLNKIIKKYD